MKLIRSKEIVCGLLLLTLAAGCGKSSESTVAEAAKENSLAPEIEGALTWINSAPLKLAQLRGKVVLLNFFEYSCVNCIRALPYLKEWQRRYGNDGLVIIGVHSPQYGFSMDPLNVYSGVKRLGLTYPIVVDSNLAIAEAYQNRFWPRLFLVDKDGRIRYEHTGEGAYAETEATIQKLLREIDPSKTFPEPLAPLRGIDKPGAVCYPITPELYLGQMRGRLGNAQEPLTNGPALFVLPPELHEGTVYALGEWANQSEYLRHTRDTETAADCIVVSYRAIEINVVMKPESVYWLQVFVQVDGDWVKQDVAGADIKYDDKGRSYVEVNSARMYNLVAVQPYGAHELRLCVQGKGLSVYSFSFGTCEIPRDVEKLQLGKEPS